MSNILEISDLHVAYAGGIIGLAGLSLVVPERKVVSLLGSNGAGKTTTLKAISNLLPFEGGRIVRGSIRFEDEDITNVPAHKLSRRGLLHVREGRKVFATMSVQENLVAATYALGNRSPLKLQQRCDDIYDLFPHLARRKALMAGYLSGGEQQMLALGRALIGEPQADADRRSVAGARAGDRGRDLPHHLAHQYGAQHQRADRRTECHAGAAPFRARLCARQWPQCP